jgi:hypothetical protein
MSGSGSSYAKLTAFSNYDQNQVNTNGHNNNNVFLAPSYGN